MFKKILFALVVFIGVSFGGVSAYVSTIDWNKHKNKIAEQFEEISGKKIVFEGPVSLAFFPSPYLSAKDIKIYNKTGENITEPLAVIDEMVTELSLLPLLQGKFTIDNMSLLNAKILIDFLPNGKLNWYSEISDFQRNKLDTVEVSLNSVLLKNAIVQVINEGLGVDITLDNLNAEVTAESLSGPYRIDGNFVKDGKPAGFALNLGTLSESFATSLNLVLTHPTTESYARFDGSMLSTNKEIKGNFIIESKKPSNFLNELTNQTILPQEFNYPIACSIELITNDQQIDLSSFIIKYGDNTAGAGNILIPLTPNPDEEKRKIEAFFEMTDLDLMPVIGIIKEQIKRLDQENQPYAPFYDFDLIADVRAVKASLNGQSVRNFNLSLDLLNDTFYIKDLSGLLAGDTDIAIIGDIYENNQILTYKFDVKSLSQDFTKFLDQIGIHPKAYAQSTYSNAKFDFGIEGNLKQFKINPLTFTIDKTTANGSLDVIRAERPNFSILLNIDNINLDNYLPPFTEEEAKLPLDDKINLLLNKLKFLQDYDIASTNKIDLAIYNQSALEKIDLQFNSNQNKIKLKKFNVENINNANIELSGELSFDNNLANFKNVKYNYKTTKFNDFAQKFKLEIPNNSILYNAQKVTSKGIFTGTVKNINVKSVNSVDKSSFLYSGLLFSSNNYLNFNGNLEFRSPDFVNFVNRIGYNYKPQYMASNIFTFKGNIGGYTKNWTAKNIDAYIGANNFKGEVSVIVEEYPQITANINANNFEFDRFIYNPDNNIIKQIKKNKTIDASLNFLKRPVFSNTPINYDVYKNFELNGRFNIDNFNIKNIYLKDFKTNLNIKQGLIKLENISAKHDKTKFSGNLTFDINSEAKIKGNLKITDYNIYNVGGKKYEFLIGKLNSAIDFDAPATSEENFIKGLNAKASVNIIDADFKGWDLSYIEEDLSKRTHSDDLFEMLRTNLQSGNTLFNTINSDIIIKNGVASLKGTILQTNNANIVVNGNADINNWSVDANFSLTFDKLKDKVLPVTYQWNGSLNNPNLVINSAALKEKYDSHWEKVRQKEEAEKKAKQEELDSKMENAQSKVTDINNLLENNVFPRLKKYETLSSNIVSKNNYATSSLVANDILNQLTTMQELKNTEFDHEDIAEIVEKTEVFDSQLNTMIRELDDTYITDIKNHSFTKYALIKGVYDNSLKKATNYQENLNKYVDHLIELQSLIIIDNEPKVSDYKNKIETSLNAIADLHNKALLIKNDISESSNINDLELQYALINESLEKVNSEMETLNLNTQELFDYTTNIVKNEEEEARKKQEQLKAAQEKQKIENEKPVSTKEITKSEDNKSRSRIIIIEEGQPIPDLNNEKTALTKPEPAIVEKSDVVTQITTQEKTNLTDTNVETPVQQNQIVAVPLSQPDNILAPVVAKPKPIQTIPTLDISTIKQSVSKETISAPNIRVPFTPIQQNINDTDNLVETPETNQDKTTVDEAVLPASQNISAEPEDKSANENEIIESETDIVETPIIEEEPIVIPIDTNVEYRPKMIPSGIITKPASSKKTKDAEEIKTDEVPLLKPLENDDELFSSGTIVKKK